jgi:hypothetical protein
MGCRVRIGGDTAITEEMASAELQWAVSSQNCSTMIPKLLTHWYGIEHWPETDATVASREEVFHGGQEGGPTESATFTFYYRDLSGSIQSGHLHIDNGSPLYALKKSDTFRIQFNPRRPSKYYCHDAATYHSELTFVFWSLVALVLLSVFIVWLLRNSR